MAEGPPVDERSDDAEAEGRGRRRRSRLLPVSIGLLAGALTGVGLVDVASAEAGARLFGGIVALVGITITVGAVTNWLGMAWSSALMWPAVVALAALLIHHAVLFGFELVTLDFFDSNLLRFSAFLALLFGLVLWNAVRHRPPRRAQEPRPQRTPRQIVRDSLGLTAVLGIAFTGVSFWYTEVYLPTIRPPFLNLSVSASPLPATTQAVDGMVPVRFKLGISNPGEIRVRILAGYFNVRGSDRPAADEVGLHMADLEALYATGVMADDGRNTLARGIFPVEGWWLEPGEELAEELVVYVPELKTDAVEIQLELHISRGERVNATPIRNSDIRGLIGDVEAGEGFPASVVIGHSEWIVRPQSLLDRIRRDPLSIIVQWRRDERGTVFTLTDVRHGDHIWVPSTLPEDMDTWTDEQWEVYWDRFSDLGARLAETGILVTTNTSAEIPLREPPQSP